MGFPENRNGEHEGHEGTEKVTELEGEETVALLAQVFGIEKVLTRRSL